MQTSYAILLITYSYVPVLLVVLYKYKWNVEFDINMWTNMIKKALKLPHFFTYKKMCENKTVGFSFNNFTGYRPVTIVILTNMNLESINLTKMCTILFPVMLATLLQL